MAPTSKRLKKEAKELTHLLEWARGLMGREKDDVRSTQTEDREFRSLFGIGAIATLAAWYLLRNHDLIPLNGSMVHLLWAMMFLKVYATETVMSRMTHVKDPKTFRHWVWPFISALSDLESRVVSSFGVNYCEAFSAFFSLVFFL